jgi:TRAP-type uncharacterized transport system substrate-binding protein
MDARVRVFGGNFMGGGRRPKSRMVRLCGALLGALAVVSVGTGVGAQTAPASKTTAVKQVKRPTVRRAAVKRVVIPRHAVTSTAVVPAAAAAISAPPTPTTVKPGRALSLRPSKHGRYRHVAARTAQPAAAETGAAVAAAPIAAPQTVQATITPRHGLWSRSHRQARYHRFAARPAVETPPAEKSASPPERANTTTITLLAGGLNSTDLAIADDLSAVLDDGDDLRILPMLGRGGGQNIRDLRLMKVDLGLTQSNLLARFRRGGEFGPTDKIAYIAKLFNEELHLFVRADAGFASIEQLAGKTVNLGPAGGDSELAARDVFERLGIAVREVNLGDNDAIEKLKSGEIDASVTLAGKPAPAMARLDGFRLLPVPFAKQLQDDYLPATLAAEDYPSMIEPGRSIETVAVGVVLIAFNWPRDSDSYRRIEKFIEAFFPRIGALQSPPRHPKWREVNLAAVLPGAVRFAAAQDWLKQHRDQSADRRQQFDQFVSTRQTRPVTTEDRERLFQEFLQWARERR